MKITSIHFAWLLTIYVGFAYIVVRHRFFMSERRRFLIALLIFLFALAGGTRLPEKEAQAWLTMGEFALPLTYFLAATLLPFLVIRYRRDMRNIRSGKTERDRLEIRRKEDWG